MKSTKDLTSRNKINESNSSEIGSSISDGIVPYYEQTNSTETNAKPFHSYNGQSLNDCSECTKQNLDIQNTNIENKEEKKSIKVQPSDTENQNSKDVYETREEEISNSKRRGCKQSCKDVTFHQFLVFTCIFFNVFICVGLPFSLGVLYPEFKVTFNSSNAEAATIVSVATGLITCGGIVGGLLVNKIGSRYTILLGALLSFIGTFASFFAMNVWFLVVALGVLMGLGNAIVYIPSMVVISEQFPNSMMATLIITAARPAGVIMLPLLINTLLDVYFWRGTVLLTSAFVLNICVSGLIATHQSSKTSSPVSLPRKKKIFDVSILKIPKFILIIITHSIINSTISAVFVLLVDFAIEVGYSRKKAVIVYTIQAVFAMLARVFVGILSLLPQRIRPPHIVLFFLSGLFGSVIILLMPLAAQNYNTLVGIIMFWGLFIGIRNAIIPVLCLELVGKDHYPIALGVSQTLIGIFTIVAGPIAGLIRDMTGTYEVTFFTAGSVSMVAAVVTSTMYIIFFTNFCKFSKKKSDANT